MRRPRLCCTVRISTRVHLLSGAGRLPSPNLSCPSLKEAVRSSVSSSSAQCLSITVLLFTCRFVRRGDLTLSVLGTIIFKAFSSRKHNKKHPTSGVWLSLQDPRPSWFLLTRTVRQNGCWARVSLSSKLFCPP